jgi:hypothetical protein
MPRNAHAPQVPQLLDSFLTMQQEIWEQSFRLLSAFARPATLPLDPANAAEAAGFIEALSEAPARASRREARPAAGSRRGSRPSAARRERPAASAGTKRRTRGSAKRK